MSEPIVSNVRVTSRPVSEPGELPPCLSMELFDGRLAVLLDTKTDCGGQHWGPRFEVAAGTAGEEVTWGCHPEMKVPRMGEEVIDVRTDDPDEAQAAYERGAEWVLTGEMGEKAS